MGLHILFPSHGSIMSEVISVLPLFWENEAGDEPSWDNTQWKKKKQICLPLWERQHVLDYELPASFLYRLVSHSMGAADYSMATPGPMLSLLSRSDFTGLPSQHPPAVFYAATPAPTPHPLLPHPPFSHSLPPVQSLQLDPLRMTPSQSA